MNWNGALCDAGLPSWYPTVGRTNVAVGSRLGSITSGSSSPTLHRIRFLLSANAYPSTTGNRISIALRSGSARTWFFGLSSGAGPFVARPLNGITLNGMPYTSTYSSVSRPVLGSGT